MGRMYKMEKIATPSGPTRDSEPTKHIKIYHLHDEEDKYHFDQFYNHLSVLRNKIENLHHAAPAGGDPYDYLKSRFEEVDVITLFLSSDFEAKYGRDFEAKYGRKMIALLNECSEKGIHIWPIIAKDYHWTASEFCKFPIFFGEDKPIASTNTPEEAFRLLVGKIDSEVTLILANKWVQEGLNYSHKRRFVEALAAYERSFQYVSNYPPALFRKGQDLRQMNRHEEAEQCFNSIFYQCPQIQQNSPTQPKGKDISSSASKQLELIQICYKGHAFLAMGKIDEALIEFQKVHALANIAVAVQKQLCAEAYCATGDAHQKLSGQASNFEQMLSAYSKAKDFNPYNPKYLDKIGQIYLERYIHSQSHSFYEQAREIYTELTASHPNFALGYVGWGDILYLSGRFQDAVKAYERAIQLDSCEARAYSSKGYALLAFKNLEDALKDFNKALVLEPNNARHYYGMGQVLESLQRYREAQKLYEQASHYGLRSVDFLLHYAEVFLALGHIASLCGDQQNQAEYYYGQAVKYYQEAADHGGRKEATYFGWGKVYCALKDWEKAQHCFSTATSYAPAMAEAHLEMARTFIELGDIGRALSYFENARQHCNSSKSKIAEADIEIALGDAYYHCAERSDSQFDDNTLNTSYSHYEKANALQEQALAYIGLGKIHILRGLFQEAIAAFDRALELQPQLSECYFLKGKCYSQVNQYSLAYEMYKIYKIAFSSNSDVVPLQFQKTLSEVLLTMKRFKEAIQIFDDIIKRMHKIDHMKADLANAYSGKGAALQKQGSYEQALICLKHAYRFDKSIQWQVEYRYTLQEIYFFFERKLYSDPQNASIHRYIGDAFVLMKRPEDAIDAYTKAMIYGDRSTQVYCWRGYAYELCQEYQRAFDEYTQALNIDPNNQTALQKRQNLTSQIQSTPPNTEQPQRNFFKKLMPWLNSSNN